MVSTVWVSGFRSVSWFIRLCEDKTSSNPKDFSGEHCGEALCANSLHTLHPVWGVALNEGYLSGDPCNLHVTAAAFGHKSKENNCEHGLLGHWPRVCWESRIGKENGNYHNVVLSWYRV